jgi:hypothetical protein
VSIYKVIAMMISMFAITWAFMPALQRLPAWLLALIVLWPAASFIEAAVYEPSPLNIAFGVLGGALPVFFLSKAWQDRVGEP